jgi:DNA-binding CsgD family transcriptional regulator
MKPLSPRQQEVLLMLADGKTNQEIADALGVALSTVMNSRQEIREKLGTTKKQLLEAATLWRSMAQAVPENIDDLINFHKAALMQYRLFLTPSAQYAEEQTIRILEKVKDICQK